MPECQKIKEGGLDQYGAEHFDRLIFATVRKSVGLKGLSNRVTLDEPQNIGDQLNKMLFSLS